MQDGEHGPDDAFGGDLGRFLGGARHAGASARTSLVDDLPELGQHLRTSFQHTRPRPQRLHQADPREAGLVVHEPQHRQHTGAQAIAPPILSHIRIADERADLLDSLVEHGEKAILPILEEVVERLTRHPRPGDHLGDGQARVANLLDRLRRRGQHAAALNLRYLSPRQAVGTGTQPRSRRACLIFRSHFIPPNRSVLFAMDDTVGAVAHSRHSARRGSATLPRRRQAPWCSRQRFMG